MNLSTALEPQGNFRGWSNVFLKGTSPAEVGRRKRPGDTTAHVNEKPRGG